MYYPVVNEYGALQMYNFATYEEVRNFIISELEDRFGEDEVPFNGLTYKTHLEVFKKSYNGDLQIGGLAHPIDFKLRLNDWTFETHQYAPELNKIFNRGIDVTDCFVMFRKCLTSNPLANLRMLREELGSHTYQYNRLQKCVTLIAEYENSPNVIHTFCVGHDYKHLLRLFKAFKDRHNLADAYRINFFYR